MKMSAPAGVGFLCILFMYISAKRVTFKIERGTNWLAVLSMAMMVRTISTAYKSDDPFVTPHAILTNVRSASDDTVCALEPSLGGTCDGTGFASLVLDAIDAIATCVTLGAKPIVYWYECGYCGDSSTNENYWNWYFEEVNPGIINTARNVFCTEHMPFDSLFALHGSFGPLCRMSFRDRRRPEYEETGYINNWSRLLANKVIEQYVKPKKYFIHRTDYIFNMEMAGFVSFGVHIRGTDHVGESNTLMPLSRWIHETKLAIDHIMSNMEHQNFRIFVAADTFEAIKAFQSAFGHRVWFTDASRSKHYHDEMNSARLAPAGNARKLLGMQILFDLLLLSRCQYFIHEESNVASLVHYWNVSQVSYHISSSTNGTWLNNGPSVRMGRDLQDVVSLEIKGKRNFRTLGDDPIDLRLLQSNFTDMEEDEYTEMITELSEQGAQIEHKTACFIKNHQRSNCPDMRNLNFATPQDVQRLFQMKCSGEGECVHLK